ncbi:Pvc16 family protein [Novispirillum itersonii]|uniref:Pvc16 N-terminal domain-containing protein n=1 Tax=Novispirillum itersonii TaxID=189 RepID=A0A7W9ZIV1_NOVIT|nr:Pvc16 family protein [Novispirillum itersonii]MBB6212290.1 hypothetical protein [Novispirillum itersonii]
MDLIGTTLELIRGRLNDSIQNLDNRPEDWVILSNIVDVDGKPYEAAINKIVLCVTSMQDEKVISTFNPMLRGPEGKYGQVTPPLYLDVNVAFIANFYNKNYRDGLVAISRTISYFQQNPYFNQQNLPGLDPAIDKLNLEFVNLDPVDLNYVMGMLGAKYLPSVFYKIRLLPFASTAMSSKAVAVGAFETSGQPGIGY